MGIFNRNYDKPGRGISKEEAAERNYFKILWRKLGKISQVNLIYIASNIIFIVAFIYFVLSFLLPSGNVSDNVEMRYLAAVFQSKSLLPINIFIPFLFIGPTKAGLNYVTRNFSKQEPVFIWSDFWSQTKKNFRQAITASIVMTVIFYLYSTAVIFYINITGGGFIVVFFAIYIGILLIFTSFYVYPMMVTFDMKLIVIFKNAFLLAMSNFTKNLLALISIILVNIILIILSYKVWIILSLIFLIAWASYTKNYIVWNAIDKYMISKIDN